jgi:NAD(P)-dependent dehydrogenase (short-subunit alcohol dehydrogenase family)
MGRLDGRVAIVTGAAHGDVRAALGSHFAKALAGEGARLACADTKDCGSVVAEIEAAGGTAIGLRVDVRDEQSVKDMVAATVRKFGRLDILVNNAAVGSNIPPVSIGQLAVSEWDELMAVNVRGPFLCAKASIPEMRRNGYGKIVNVGSSTMVSGLPNRLHYVTAKGAILAMTRSMARELGPDGIRVNTIAYGLIMSPQSEHEFGADPARHKAYLAQRSMPVDMYPKDIVGTLVFLASADSDAMTGQFVNVDSGGVFV